MRGLFSKQDPSEDKERGKFLTKNCAERIESREVVSGLDREGHRGT